MNKSKTSQMKDFLYFWRNSEKPKKKRERDKYIWVSKILKLALGVCLACSLAELKMSGHFGKTLVPLCYLGNGSAWHSNQFSMDLRAQPLYQGG